MLKNYLKITFRNLLKNKVFVIVNILGLGVAIGCCIVAWLNYDFNVNFDQDQKNISSINRVDVTREVQNEARNYGMSPMPLGKAIDQNIGDVDAIMRFIPSGGNFRIEDELFNNNFTFVDANFFEMFSFNIINGNKDGLSNKSNIYINEQLAKKYFADKDPIGELLTHLTDNGPKDYTVAGVFADMPLNSSFGSVSTITNIDNYFDLSEESPENNWLHWATLFVKVNNPDRIPVIEGQLKEYIEIQNNARLDFKVTSYFLEPFDGMGHRAANDETYGHWLHSSLPPPAVVVPSVMAILILLIACFNFTNTSIAISSKRLKEIGLRKVMGGLRKQLVMQFMLENLMLCFFSLIVGVVVAMFLVPAYSEMWPFLTLEMNLVNNMEFFGFLLILLLFIGLIAGSYPAFYISKFEPASILKGTLKMGGTNKLTNTLLTLQFSISLIAIILGAIFYQNAIYQEELDFGFNKDGAITVYLNSEDEFRAYENVIAGDPRIKSVAASEFQINRSYRNDPIKSEDKEFDVDILHVGENYLETMDFTIIEGRGFRKDSETDFQESVLVSEELVRVFGWKNAIGKKVVWMDTVQLYVVGVMKDVYLNGLWEPMEPLMVRYSPPQDYRFLTVKAGPTDLIAVNEFLEDQWKQLFPDKMYTGTFMDENMGESAMINNNILKLFGFLGTVALLLSAIGLFSLVSLNIVKRMKEIGVRKVLGASVASIIGLLNRNFIIILMIAAILGSAASYFLGKMLMSSIWTYFIDPGIMAFLVSIIIIFIVAGLTIGVKVYRAATANPVSTLRTE